MIIYAICWGMSKVVLPIFFKNLSYGFCLISSGDGRLDRAKENTPRQIFPGRIFEDRNSKAYNKILAYIEGKGFGYPYIFIVKPDSAKKIDFRGNFLKILLLYQKILCINVLILKPIKYLYI